MIRFRVGFFALAISAVAICASSRLPDAGVAWARSGPVPHMLTIVAFGSSSTQGVGASSPAAAYPAQLETMLRASLPREVPVVVNRGIGGEDIDDMMVRFDKDVIDSKPDLVIWQTGSNDPMRHVPLDRFEQKMRAGIVAMRKAGISIVLMEPQWCPTLDRVDPTNRFRDKVRAIGAEMGVKVIRRSDLMHDWIRTGRLTMATMVSPDGLHMRDDGYRMLASEVAADILDMPATASRRVIKTAGL